MQPITDTVPIDDHAIASALERHRHTDAVRVRDVLVKARELNGPRGRRRGGADDASAIRTCCGELFDDGAATSRTPSTAGGS